VATEWKLQGTRPKIMILANCPTCSHGAKIDGSLDPALTNEQQLRRVIQQRFKHGALCGTKEEAIPKATLELYSMSAFGA
jgi:hypothetical protein